MIEVHCRPVKPSLLHRSAEPAIQMTAVRPMKSTIPIVSATGADRTKDGHGLHGPFRVTTHRGHTVQTFQSLELALEAAKSLGPDHYVIDRHGLQIWNPQRELLRNEE